MRRTFLTFLTLTLASLACALPVGTQVPNAAALLTATPNATETVLPTRTVTPNAWTANVRQPTVTVRDAPDGEPTGDYLSAGDVVDIVRRDGNWYLIKKPVRGWVFAGCLTVSSGLGCRAR